MSKKITVLPYEKGLLYKKGRFIKLLDSGHYTIYPWQSSHIDKMDTREHTCVTEKKEYLTTNRCSVALVFVIRYKVIDPVCAAHTVENYHQQIIQDLQFATQKYIRAQTLESIFNKTNELLTNIEEEVIVAAKEYGICVRTLQIDEITSPRVSSEAIDIWEYEKGLLFCQGKFEKILDSGRYTLHSWQHSTIIKVDTRETTKNIQVKNIYTKNDIKVNIALRIHYKVTEPQKICTVKDYDSQIFQDISELLEQDIRNHTIEEALHENTIAQKLQKEVIKTKQYGIEITSIKIESIRVPHKEDQVIDIWEYEKGLLYREGKFEEIINCGRYVIRSWEPVHIVKLDLRESSQTIQGQEILTKDKIGIRITLVAQYKIIDPIAAVHNVENYQQQLYQDLQLTLRENITGRLVEEILEDRDALSQQLLEEVAPRGEKYGILVQRIGIKDIILPGVVRNVFLQEVEADRRGRADRIAARYAISVARSKANAAKILQENPNVMRLKELETLAELASKEGNLIIIPGLNNLYSSGTSGASDGKV
ncbi:SPFH domain-containing protein [Candidatus Uabimicrobium amorphum]|uniref:Band 7 domain-containing protein n=1 Tax=Uabimicrobium amorphum TaxID=2596890 RepID=A0A5S9F4G2_UABAM|nr:SPFH domain-containing protein [Candidatus Uabimicrobium amorphum]BBM85508.1 hypothetical protein UABAM_03877 [Candidatus Uabimicrobium amorphum]